MDGLGVRPTSQEKALPDFAVLWQRTAMAKAVRDWESYSALGLGWTADRREDALPEVAVHEQEVPVACGCLGVNAQPSFHLPTESAPT